jgi:hypothetical protein
MRALHPGELSAYASHYTPYPVDAHYPFSIGGVTFSTLRDALGSFDRVTAIAAQIEATPYLQRLLITWYTHYDPRIIAALPRSAIPILSDPHAGSAPRPAPSANTERELAIIRAQLEDCREALIKSKQDLHAAAEADRDAAAFIITTHFSTPRPSPVQTRALYAKDPPVNAPTQTDPVPPPARIDRAVQAAPSTAHAESTMPASQSVSSCEAAVGPAAPWPIQMFASTQRPVESLVPLAPIINTRDMTTQCVPDPGSAEATDAVIQTSIALEDRGSQIVSPVTPEGPVACDVVDSSIVHPDFIELAEEVANVSVIRSNAESQTPGQMLRLELIDLGLQISPMVAESGAQTAPMEIARSVARGLWSQGVPLVGL